MKRDYLALALLASSELFLIATLVYKRGYRVTPSLFLYTCFALGSALTYDPMDTQFTAAMARISDWLKAIVLLETFCIVSRGLDATDRTLSAAIGVLASATVVASAHGMVSRVSVHMEALVGLASFACAMCWWAWRRGECTEHAWVLCCYLVVKAGAVLLWSFTGGWGWAWINGGAMLAEAGCFVGWSMHDGPQIVSAKRQAECESG